MAINYTDEQQRVIDVRGKNVLVSAAAGSGKTAVLVERIASLVCDEKNNINIDELLVVTFTKAAAAEMRERILKRIGQKLEENPESEHLQKQYALVHRAMITTIDAFCQNILRNHFQEIDLDPDFRVMDTREKNLVIQDVIEQLLEDMYASDDEDFKNTASFFSASKASDDDFEELIIGLYNYAESFDRPEKFLLERKKDHENLWEKVSNLGYEDGKFTGDPFGVFLIKHLTGMAEGYARMYDGLIDICNEEDGPSKYIDTLKAECEAAERLMAAKSFEEYERLLDNYLDIAGTLPSIGKKDFENGVSEDKKKSVAKERNDKIKAKLKEIKTDYFYPSLKEKLEESERCDSYVQKLIDITIEFRNRLQAEKKSRKVVDFGDMEHYALEILVDEEGNPTPVALEYRDHFKEIMVDEYQDSNLVQDVMLDAISRKEIGSSDRFMVGDVKQSIYGFRQARPDLFLEKYASYVCEEGCERIDLSKNFRSRKEVLDTANDIFDCVMHERTGNIEYDADSRLNPMASYLGGDDEGVSFNSELILLDSKFSEELDVEEDVSKETQEAYVLAEIIHRLMREQKVTRKKEVDGEEISYLDNVRYGDIVILHRTPSKIADAISQVFEKKDIPISITQGGGYFSAPEVSAVLQFIRTINNPLMDIPLYGSLTSVFGGYTPAQIAEIRAGKTDMPLYEAIKDSLPEFVQKIEEYRKLATFMTIRELVQKIYDDHNYLEYTAALPAGVKRKANAEMLLTYASDFEKTSYYGLYQFVRYIDLAEKYTSDSAAEADVLGEDADVVKLMSIHKSKGLEFPVTIVAGMGKSFNRQDEKSFFVKDNILGVGCNYVDLTKRTLESTLRHELIVKKNRADQNAEEMRLLYVALTRAKEKLIMVGRCKDAEQVLDKYQTAPLDVFSYGNYMAANSYLDYVLPFVGKLKLVSSVISGQDIEIGDVEDQLLLSSRMQQLDDAEKYADCEKVKKILDRFEYKYPYDNLKGLYAKTTVSDLKMAAMMEENETAHEKFESREKAVYIPNFREEKEEITGPVRGDSYHRVMEIMDYDRCVGVVTGGRPATYEEYREKVNDDELLESIKKFLEEELKDNRITEVCSRAVNPIKIKEFLLSKLCFRMWSSNQRGLLRREQPFVLSLPASKLDADYPDTESVIIQGIVDAFFEEDGEIVLMDYKTDAVETEEELISRYAAQLDYYEEAITRLTGKRVKERILYSFKLGREIEVCNC